MVIHPKPKTDWLTIAKKIHNSNAEKETCYADTARRLIPPRAYLADARLSSETPLLQLKLSSVRGMHQ
jgi:hypothetical protein